MRPRSDKNVACRVLINLYISFPLSHLTGTHYQDIIPYLIPFITIMIWTSQWPQCQGVVISSIVITV